MGRYGVKISYRYLGAAPFSALKISTRILKSILSWAGSQWNSFTKGALFPKAKCPLLFCD